MQKWVRKMDKQSAIKYIKEADDKADIAVAVFPSNICPICHKAKDTLFVESFANTFLECCGGCAIKLQKLQEILDDLLPEQTDLLMRRMH